MASITKLYLRDDTWLTVRGFDVEPEGTTLPGTASLDASAPPDVTATGAATNLGLSPTAGTAQASNALTTLGQTAAQDGWLRRFVSEPLAAQSIGAQTITYSGAHSESNAASDFLPSIGLYLWDAAGNKLRSTLLAVGTLALTEPGTTQTAGSATATSTAGSATAGDLLVVEIWRKSGTQTNNAGRTNTVFYAGTAEASTTSVASFVSFSTAVVINTTYKSSLAASASFAGSLSTSYIAAPPSNPGLTAILTHTE